MGYLSRLDAVNMMMLSAGESLVADLQEASGIDTGIAEFLLDQASLEQQLRGVAENKYTKTLSPDNNGHILLGYPNNDYEGVLEAVLLSTHKDEDGNVIVGRVSQDNPPRLYNMNEDTDKWDDTEEYVVSITAMLRWEQLDTTTQRSVLASAMRKYQMMTQGDRAMDQLLAQDEAISKVKSKANDMNDKNRNVLSRYPGIFRMGYLNDVRSRRGGT
jgi:hypothetical protein